MRATYTPSLEAGDYPFTHRLRVRFAETDAMTVVHHGSYLLYLEEARVEFLRHAGYPYDKVRADGVEFPVAEVKVRYLRPLRFDDQVDVHAVIGKVSAATFQMGYLVAAGGEARATAVTVHAAIDTAGRAVRIPDWVRHLSDT